MWKYLPRMEVVASVSCIGGAGGAVAAETHAVWIAIYKRAAPG